MSIEIADIIAARAEAVRFIHACDKAKDRLKKIKSAGVAFAGSKEVGSLRRASLDLARALAEMRKRKGGITCAS